MQDLFTLDAIIALVTLTVLEIVLGIDNIVFISILAGKLPPEQRERARVTGLALAMISRILLLLSINWVRSLTTPLFHLPFAIPGLSEETALHAQEITGQDIVVILGGLFLIYKSTVEIHDRLEGETGHASAKVAASFGSVIAQILLLDLVFSLDSVITAVGIAEEVWVMIVAVVIAVLIMLVASGRIADFVNRHPTVKMLALSFLLLIGVTLFSEGLGIEIPKGYIYFAMAFSVFVEVLNLRTRGRVEPVTLHQPYAPEQGSKVAGAAQQRAA